MGTIKSLVCKDIVKNIIFCAKNKIWINAAHVSRAENVIADYESINFYKDAEWIIN